MKELTVYKKRYLVPVNFEYASLTAGTMGSSAVDHDGPTAMALTKKKLHLCDETGSYWSIPLLVIKEVDICEFSGLTVVMHSSAGPTRVVPKNKFGVEITYEGLSSNKHLRVLVFYADIAREWVSVIGRAIDDLDVNHHALYKGYRGEREE